MDSLDFVDSRALVLDSVIAVRRILLWHMRMLAFEHMTISTATQITPETDVNLLSPGSYTYEWCLWCEGFFSPEARVTWRQFIGTIV